VYTITCSIDADTQIFVEQFGSQDGTAVNPPALYRASTVLDNLISIFQDSEQHSSSSYILSL